MTALKLRPVLLLLVASVAAAQVYKWVDEQGNTHFSDSPPDKADAEELTLPQGPSAEEIAAAQEELRRRLEARQESDLSQQVEIREPEPAELRPGTGIDAIRNGELACFTPLSSLVAGDSGARNAPITPSQLTENQRRLLEELFGRLDGSWRGEFVDVACAGDAAEWSSSSQVFELKTVADWNPRESQLVVESDSLGKVDRSSKRLFQNYKVADGLYVRDGRILAQGWTNLAVEGNKVEIVALERESITFLIKRRAQGGHWSSEIRHIESGPGKLRFSQVYFARDILTGWRTWTLERR